MKTYERLVEELGIEKVNAFMMQHLVYSLSKAMKYDEVISKLDNPKCTLDDIRELLEDNEE